MNEDKKNQLGRADMSARVPTPMTDAMAMRPAVQRPVELKVKSEKMYGGGYVKKYAKGGGVRKVRYT